MRLTRRQRRLELKHPWTLSRGTSLHKDYWFVELEDGGIIGRGEAAHNVRYGESLESIEVYLERVAGGGDVEGEAPAAGRAAIDIAKHDLRARKLGVPVCELLGVERRELEPTSYSIGIESPDAIGAKVAEAEEFEILKVKLGGERDKEVMWAVRKVTDKVVRVDANEGWSNREEAARQIDWLAGLNVELVEQPMPAGRLDDVAWLKERVPLPLIADEDALGLDSIGALAGVYHGVNVKLMKAGGIEPAREAIRAARNAGLKVMIGCMIESSLGISAAAHLAPLADYVDLDGHLLLTDDPFEGLECRDGRLVVPSGIGLGVEPVSATDLS